MNTRSIRHKVLQVMSYLTENNIDIAFIQESWIKKTDGHLITEIKEFGYSLISYRKPRRLDLGGGVAVIYKNTLKVQTVKTNTYRSFENVECKLLTEGGWYLFSNMYRPDYSQKNRYTVKHFIEEYSSYIDELCSHSLPTILLGDYNLHLETLFDSYIENKVK